MRRPVFAWARCMRPHFLAHTMRHHGLCQKPRANPGLLLFHIFAEQKIDCDYCLVKVKVTQFSPSNLVSPLKPNSFANIDVQFSN